MKNNFEMRHVTRRKSKKNSWIGNVLDFCRRNVVYTVIGGVCVILIAATVIFLPPMLNKNAELNTSTDPSSSADIPVDFDEPDLTDIPVEIPQNIPNGETPDYYDYDNVDSSVLEGLAGGEFTKGEIEELGGVDYTNQIAVGILVGTGEDAGLIMDGFGEYSEELLKAEVGLNSYIIYKLSTVLNQNIQYVRSMINRGAKAVILAGLSKEDFNMLAAIAHSNGVKVVAVNAPVATGYAVNINFKYDTLVDPNHILAKKISTLPGKLLFVSDAKNSSYTNKVTGALNANGVSDYISIFKSESGFAKKIADLYPSGYGALQPNDPHRVYAKGDIMNYLIDMPDGIKRPPKAYISDGTAGFLRRWYALKNEGLEITLKPKTDTTPAQVDRIFAKNTVFYAVAAFSGYDVGRVACRFALNFALGRNLKTDKVEYNPPISELITQDNFTAYYERYKDIKSDSKAVSIDYNIDAIDEFFTK